jgi:hypothetical protein
VTINRTAASSKFGLIQATGAANLAGTLNVTLTTSFTPTTGDHYMIVVDASQTGKFSAIKGLNLPGNLALSPSYNAKNVTLTVSTTPSPAPAPAPPRWPCRHPFPLKRGGWPAAIPLIPDLSSRWPDQGSITRSAAPQGASPWKSRGSKRP